MTMPSHSEPKRPAFSVRRVTGLDAIAAERATWQALAARRDDNRPFAGPGFLIAAARAFHAEAKPELWLLEAGGEAEAALMLIDRPLRKSGLTIAEIGSHNNPHALITDLLLSPDAAIARMQAEALMRALREASADSILLQHVPAPVQAEIVLAAARAAGFGCDGLEPSRELYFIACPETYEAYLASRSGDFRSQLKKRIRKAGQSGGYAVEILAGREAIRSGLATWFDIETRSWQGVTPGAAMSDMDRAFMVHLIDELADDEVGELFLLRFDGKPAAALRMLGGNRRTCVHTMHYDQAFEALSPGTLLLDAMMRDAWSRGLAEVDLHGNSKHFKRWATGSRAHATMRLFKPGIRGLLLRQGRRVMKRLARSAEPAAAESGAGS